MNTSSPGPSSGGGAGDRQTARRNDSEMLAVANPASSYGTLSNVLQECGYLIKQPVTNNELFVDVEIFQKNLADWLVQNEDEMRRVETETSKFLRALKAYVTENFTLTLKLTKHEIELVKPSLLRCLLGIESIQSDMIDITMNMLDQSIAPQSDEDVQIVSMILDQLAWLPVILKDREFTDRIMTMIDNAVFKYQTPIIKKLSEIVPTNLHYHVVEILQKKFNDEKPEMIILLMECFPSLEVPDASLLDIRIAAANRMASSSLKDIPAYLAFLFSAESTDTLDSVIREIREHTELKGEGRNQRDHDHQIDILEKVGFCVAVNPKIATFWMKQIKGDIRSGLVEELKKIDLLMLLLFATESSEGAVRLLRSLFAQTKLTMKLFSELTEENKTMVLRLFSQIAKILDSFMRTRGAGIAKTVQEVTFYLFVNLTRVEAYRLLDSMTSVLVNLPDSRGLVLNIIAKLADCEPKKLSWFSSHLMRVLDYVSHFSTPQVRVLMNTLAILSQTQGTNVNFNAEFSILLRKQMTHSDLKVRCYGVLGALAAVRSMATLDTPDCDRINELCKLVWQTVERDEKLCGLFFDEFYRCVAYLPSNIHRDTCKMFMTKFQELWTVDAKKDPEKICKFSEKSKLRLVAAFGANVECVDDSVTVVFEDESLKMSPLVVPAYFRVLAALLITAETAGVGLMEIDTLLGSPLLLPSMAEYYGRDSLSLFTYSQRIQLGRYLVLAINFFRETVSAFVHVDDADLRVKIWLRLENILTLQLLLVKHFDSFPYLPCAYVADKTIDSSLHNEAGPSRNPVGKMWTRKPNPAKQSSALTGRRKRKAIRTHTSDSASGDETSEPATASSSVRKSSKLDVDEEIQPERITPYLRRFDKAVFQLLRYPLQCADENGTDFDDILANLSIFSRNPSAISDVEKFSPATMVLMLTEMRRQIDDKERGLDILSIPNILKYICSHVTSIEAVLADEENDIKFSPAHLAKLKHCLSLLIGLMTLYFDVVNDLDAVAQEWRINEALLLLASSEVQLEKSVLMASVSAYLGRLTRIAETPKIAADHIKLLKTVHNVLEGPVEMKRVIDEAVRVYLQRKWILTVSQIRGLLAIWLGTSPSPITVIQDLVQNLALVDGNVVLNPPNVSTFKSCSPKNFHVWYSAMFAGLSQHAYKNLRRSGMDFEETICGWTVAVDIFSSLVEVTTRGMKNVHIFSSLLGNCKLFLETFTDHGAAHLLKYWQESSEDARRFHKVLAASYRQIQAVCEHSKKTVNNQLLKKVPHVKRALEKLMFQFREIVTVHGAVDAFRMGSLVHRDIQLERIASQVILAADGEPMMTTSSSDGADSDDEGDNCHEEDMMDTDETGGESSDENGD